MCGVTGYWVRRGDPTAWLKDLGASVESLRARGPDDNGVWVRPGGRVALGQTRLSILDLSPHGHQPMRSPNGQLRMVFNGEVYNFATIRGELQALGYTFRSTGDSEVILSALQEWGPKAVDKFIGMFAIALWNEGERRLLLLRDRMGVKPLYYAWDGNRFWFGSELKALRAFDAWEPEIDRNAVGEYLQFGYISAPRSVYRNVGKLLPGHWLELGEVGEPVVRQYWAPPASGVRPLSAFETAVSNADSGQTPAEAELERELEHRLVDAFRYRMVADVPVGVFLSGGIDSSLVAAILQRYGGGELRTFTIGFDDPRFDESPHAKAVARHLGTHHTEQILNVRDMEEVLTCWGDLFDEPFGDSSGVPTYLVSRLARQHVKVALSADGGDELFNGYNHYTVLMDREQKLARWPLPARSVFSKSLGAFGPGSLSAIADSLPLPATMRHAARRNFTERLEKLRVMMPSLDRTQLYDLAMSSWTPWEIDGLMGDYELRQTRAHRTEHFADQMSRTDVAHFLPDDILVKVDRTTMACGLEGREPLLDHRLAEFALQLPLSLRRGPLGPKHLMRKILYKYVPREILERPKQGFGVPLSSWLRGDLSGLVDEYLSPARIRDGGLFDPDQVAQAVRNFRDGGTANDRLDTQKLWYLLSFEMWRSRWMTSNRKELEGAPDARAVHYQ
ncbi:MAG TPA: asparagine synthase (glutamine-hydrolyzing) [Usitatibacter sp.]|jgi:asparagine synthase (glutamine-hydrolysing)|nr:asparagine synthase (glutamine-hydrolyzing) [Usitatibacter sp.]